MTLTSQFSRVLRAERAVEALKRVEACLTSAELEAAQAELREATKDLPVTCGTGARPAEVSSVRPGPAVP